MPTAPVPDDENERLAALIALDIVGTGRTVEFDIFPTLARSLFSTSIAAISLVDDDRQYKSALGLDADQRHGTLSSHISPGSGIWAD